MCLGPEGDFGSKHFQFAFADGGFEGGDAVAEIGLAPGPAAAEGLVGGEPGDGTDGTVAGRVRIDMEHGAFLEVDVGLCAKAPGRLAGGVESDLHHAAGDIELIVW